MNGYNEYSVTKIMGKGLHTFRPMTAGIGSSPPRDPADGLDGIENGWMDGFIHILGRSGWTVFKGLG